jgi:hypothetical protein
MQKGFAKNAKPQPRKGETPAVERVEWAQVKTKRTLAVQWTAAESEPVLVVFTTGLETRAVDRFLQFARTHNPNYARYSATNDPRRGKPTLVF